MWACAVISSPVIGYVFGLRGLILALAALLGIPVLYLLLRALMAIIGTPKLIRAPSNVPFTTMRDGDVSLHLRDKPRR
jgi:hypothetical protein